jgi:hypothetical protein
MIQKEFQMRKTIQDIQASYNAVAPEYAERFKNEMEDWPNEAGFVLEETLVREPNPELEPATQRAYLFARKPQTS